MALVDYSDSEGDDSSDVLQVDASPPSKKRKLSTAASVKTELPPLPPAFRDLYSSTVRTSTQDDPSLHGGRKRVTPHVAGSWPTHVYLEWNPSNEEAQALQALVDTARLSAGDVDGRDNIHSLLRNDLGVALPLHVSLSRPLALRTAQKEGFLDRLTTRIRTSHVQTSVAQAMDTIWHPNEDKSRWFFVLRLCRPPGDELRQLLKLSNGLAREFKQPQLYHRLRAAVSGADHSETIKEAHDSFHVSLAWSLRSPETEDQSGPDISKTESAPFDRFRIRFTEVKVRIGQDVSSIPLQAQRNVGVKH